MAGQRGRGKSYYRPASVKDICSACRGAACDDCVRWFWQGQGCDHDCDAIRQLGLFALEDIRHGSLPASGERDDPW